MKHRDQNADVQGSVEVPGLVVQVPSVPVPAGTSLPAILSAAPNAWGLLRAFRRRWFLALCAGLVLAVLVGGTTWAVIPTAKYRARATVQVSANAPKIIFDVTDADYNRYQRKQLSLIRMRSVLNAALRDPKVKDLPLVRDQEDAIEWLDKNLQASFPNGAEFLQLAMEGDKPDDVAALVNAVQDAYMREIVDKEQADRQARLTMLRDTFNKYEDGLKEKRRYLKSLITDLGSADPKINENRMKLEMDRLDFQTRNQMNLQAEIMRLKTDLGVLEGQEKVVAESAIPEEELNDRLEKDAAIESVRQKLKDLEADRAEFFRVHKLKEMDPAYPILQRRQKALQEALSDLKQKIKPRILKEVREQLLSKTRVEIGVKRQQLSIAEANEKTIGEMVKHLREDLNQFRKGALDLSQLQKEMQMDDMVSTALGNELARVTVEIVAPPRVTVFEKAEVPKTKDESKPLRMGAMAALAALVCGVLGVCWLEFRARRVDGTEDLVHGLGLRLVGSLPPVPGRLLARRSSLNGHWHKRMAESIDATRTLLIHKARIASWRVLVVTSALTGEGKTSVSCHLATSLARGGYRTLLIDGDLRRPAVHRLFGVPVGPGFSEVLRGESMEREVSQATPVPGLWVMPAGNWDSAATRALAQEGARAAFERLRNTYDFVVVDTSPVLPVVDSLLIGQHADAVLFSVLRDVSCLNSVYTAQQRLSGLGIQILGVVVNGAPDHDRYGYYYGESVSMTAGTPSA